MKANFYTKLLSLSAAVIAVILISQLFIHSAEPNKQPEVEIVKQPTYAISSLDIPNNINFAGEKAPIQRYDVKESFDRELLVNTYWQSQTILFIKRANRYFPIIEPILKEQGVPDDFKYLSIIESSFMPRAKSPAGAVGLWQFMRATAREYGLEVTKEVDERYHIEKSTLAACKYLKKMHAHYDSWTLAAAAYNAGRSGVNRQLDRQKTDSYYDLLLGEETGRYVYRILAIKEILTNAEHYGFFVKNEDVYPHINTIDFELKTGIKDFAVFAQQYGITYKELKNLNPWLREAYITNSSKKSYTLKLPEASKKYLNNPLKVVPDSTQVK
ncbi:lytic transglycosylase domain-containing protein [Carboxylicivirga sp. M1479]|uniref:lytic transglycosylase domain-containing protein n=1 Tax=Carboxylicivirga sp. M1479 TaxID=2594476 RepID=UPI0011776B3C|nr:lytic transglycosylase domain-containing protein [Carboxylicivirga sp. M1479]TRX66052.1 lytic transglycosylase domain-containing protein [Carboxylicivirga sp. M1479]